MVPTFSNLSNLEDLDLSEPEHPSQHARESCEPGSGPAGRLVFCPIDERNGGGAGRIYGVKVDGHVAK